MEEPPLILGGQGSIDPLEGPGLLALDRQGFPPSGSPPPRRWARSSRARSLRDPWPTPVDRSPG